MKFVGGKSSQGQSISSDEKVQIDNNVELQDVLGAFLQTGYYIKNLETRGIKVDAPRFVDSLSKVADSDSRTVSANT